MIQDRQQWLSDDPSQSKGQLCFRLDDA